MLPSLMGHERITEVSWESRIQVVFRRVPAARSGD